MKKPKYPIYKVNGKILNKDEFFYNKDEGFHEVIDPISGWSMMMKHDRFHGRVSDYQMGRMFQYFYQRRGKTNGMSKRFEY